MRKHHSTHWSKRFLALSFWLALASVIFFTDPQFWWAKGLFLVFFFGGTLTTLGLIVAIASIIFVILAYFQLANLINFLLLLALTLLVKYTMRRG